MKQVVYSLVLCCMLGRMVGAMEEIQDDGQVHPRGLRCCCTQKASSHAKGPKKHVGHGLAVMSPLYGDPAEYAKKAKATELLLDAVIKRNAANVLFYLAQGADVNAKDGIGWAPLHYAVRDRNVEIVTILLAVGGIDIESKNGSGQSVLRLVQLKRECATQEQQNRCDIILRSIALLQEGKYPYIVNGDQLIEVASGELKLGSS